MAPLLFTDAKVATADFDFDAYCSRINYSGSREPSVATLKGLHYAHVHNVPFENLDIFFGKRLSLEPADLFAKIVSQKRGGYCYEVNSFFAIALQAFGFQVQGLLARVLYGFSNFRPRSHQLLLVTVENEPWIADVGFGSCCLREALRLTPGVVCLRGDARRPLARLVLVHVGAVRASRLRAFQLLELDFAKRSLDPAEGLHTSQQRRTHCGG